jgi:carboxyl-terminal processing protease
MKKSQFFVSKILVVALTATILLSVVSSNNSEAQLGKKELSCDLVDQIQSAYLANHLVFNQKDAELEKRVVEQYIKRNDPGKLYFLESDVATMQGWMKNLFQKLAKEDCGFMTEIKALVEKRITERTEFVKSLLGKDFKLDRNLVFEYDPENRKWPKEKKEVEDFLGKYVQFQIAKYTAAEIKLDDAKSRVIKNYDRVLKKLKEEKEPDLVASYLNSFALSLDPHSNFLAPDNYEDFKIDMALNLEGIGATLSQEDGFTVIEALVTGGAAAKSGALEPKDKIVSVSDKSGKLVNVVDMDLKDVVKMIRGPKGTKVKLSILRLDKEQTKKFEVDLIREKINLEDNAISIHYIDKTINNTKKKIGVINFPSFYADSKMGGRSSSEDMKKIVNDAKKNKADGLVVDLSTNGGGSLDDAVKIGGLFIKTGAIVKQTGRSGFEAPLADTDSDINWNGPVVILTSRLSASASEILSGAMKDYNRAVIVGADHTYGKGSIQQVPQLPFGLGALKVTIGMFYTPGGFSTQHRGVEADIVFPSPYSTDEIGEKSMDYSLPPKQLKAFLSPDANTDNDKTKWLPIKDDWIKTMKARSQERVAKSEEFKKVVAEIEKNKKEGKQIKISDILSDKGEKEKKIKKSRYADKKERDKEYLNRPEIQEAGNVLTDLILLEEGKVKTLPQVTMSN